MYRFSPSGYVMRAMRAVRLGSYSIVLTRPAMPCLSRLKSLRRYWRLWPPPRHRTETRPRLRPPLRLSASSNDLSGSLRVNSSKLYPVIPLRPADVGLKILMPILSSVRCYSNNSMRSPLLRVTIAFFQDGVRVT